MKLTACQNNSCANGGECLDESISFQCNCLPGWKGITCRENINECSEIPRQTGRSLCQNNAGCRDLLGSYKCLCSSAWEGKHCEIRKLNKNSNNNNNSNNTQHHHDHSEDNCLHNQFVNETVRKDRLHHRYNEFIMLFLILTITFLIAIFAFSGGILFFCTSYKYQKVRRSNSSSLLSLFRNKSVTRNNESSPSELTKTHEHRTLNSHRFVYSIHQQQQQQQQRQQQRPSSLNNYAQDWPCLLYVNKSFSDRVFVNVQKNSYDDNQNCTGLSSVYETPQSYVNENNSIDNNTNIASFIKLDRPSPYCRKDQLDRGAKVHQDSQYNDHQNCQYCQCQNLENPSQLSQSLIFNTRPDTPPPTYETSIGLNTIIHNESIN
ncbi:unnamed protein product [Trichobilharzia regenti]|nr:unnamed protein product [Trichobilharzia regenti]